MAYFPNGSSFAHWQDDTCSDCMNYRDNGTGSQGCAITDALFILSYEQEKASRPFVDFIIPEDGEAAWKCQMKLTAADIEADRIANQFRRDSARYKAAMEEMSSASPAHAEAG